MFNSAATFLDTCGKLTQDNAMKQLSQVLSKLNMDMLNDDSTTEDFITAQKKVQKMCRSGTFQSSEEAQNVALIIAGDVEAIKSAAANLENWFELVPPYLFFAQPRATLPQLRDIVKVSYFDRFI
ncbi:unnamed protein product [Gongylonema pulchrum]|uniref:Nuclear pore complex protein Nup85 n=1 Tax=Gongylonema pulchrum TaxID=637853 RepID=A0A183ESC8_9BILA|nr:unnamed protein product [Gongylonema pulchrum]